MSDLIQPQTMRLTAAILEATAMIKHLPTFFDSEAGQLLLSSLAIAELSPSRFAINECRLEKLATHEPEAHTLYA